MSDQKSEIEEQKEKRPYPYYVICFLSNEFCERFAYFGLRAILALYLSSLGFDDDICTVIYHVFVIGAYAWPLLGASLADSYWGKYKVIFWFSIIYIIGMMTQAFSALPFLSPADAEYKWTNIVISIIGLLIVGVGTGGIKPCVSTMGGDQFEDDDEAGRQTFFYSFYVCINIGSLISMLVTPKVRGIDCGSLGTEDSCYFLAFLIPAILMTVAFGIFMAGSKWYIKKPASGDNVMLLHLKAIHYGLWSKGTGDEEHWLDKAKGHVPDWMIRDCKYLVPLLLVLAPQPIYWCAYNQTGSRWVFEALSMDGWVFNGAFLVLPDQITILNGAEIIVFVPLFAWLYKVINKCAGYKICTELRKWGCGYLMMSLAFISAALVQKKIEQDKTVMPEYDTELSLRVLNLQNEVIYGTFTDADMGLLPEEMRGRIGILPGDVTYTLDEFDGIPTSTILLETEKGSSTYGFNIEDDVIDEQVYFDISGGRSIWNMAVLPNGKVTYPGWARKNENSKNYVQLVSALNKEIDVQFTCAKDSSSSCKESDVFSIGVCEFDTGMEANKTDCIYGQYKGDNLLVLPKGDYVLNIDGQPMQLEFNITSGATYTFTIMESADKKVEAKFIKDIESNIVPVGYIIPQYTLLTIGEVLFTTTGYTFCYEQAPPSLKSVVQAYLLMCSALGNIIVIIVAEGRLFESQVTEFYFFSLLVLVGMVLNILLSLNYVYVENEMFSTFEYPSNQKAIEGVENEEFDEDEI